MTESPNRLRVQRQDRIRLKKLAKVDEIQEEVGDSNPDYEQLMRVVLPEPNGENELARPEEDMVFVNLEEIAYERTHQLVGENVSVHEAVNHFLDEFLEERDIDLSEIEL